MSSDLRHTLLVTLTGKDRLGLISAVTSRLFDLGINLGDTSFAVLGEGFDFTAVCDTPADLSADDVDRELSSLPELEGASIGVEPFDFEVTQGPTAQITHRVEVSGGDRPGMIARLTEVFQDFGANLVRMNSVRVPLGGDNYRYVTSFSVYIPAGRADSCLAAVSNTANALQCEMNWERVA
ncbi:MAG: ACT domain-containing protein [Alphaproteobacteria bacterium]|nr:ACT domain-containing protein [Alphaproteobacteria bacterium]